MDYNNGYGVKDVLNNIDRNVVRIENNVSSIYYEMD